MKLKKYISLFRLRCVTGLQYRAAALAGISTQFAWGFLIIFAYHAFYRSDPTAFPMTLQATVNYTWIQQAFLAMFASWVLDGDILEEITSGSISYSLCRPVDLYAMWYTKSLSGRISKVALRAVPILVVAALLPAGYNLTAPTDLPTFFLFLLTMVLGALNSTAFTLLIYVLTMYTLSSTGLRSLLLTLADFLCGGVVPLPFFPPALRRICELTPFAATSNVPYRVYSGDIAGTNAAFAVGLQIFWLLVLVLGGHILDRGGHFINPLIDAVFGVLDGHGAEGGRQIAQNAVVSIGFPGVGVPVVAQGGAIRMIRIGGRGFSCGGFGQSGAAGQQHAQRQDDG